jgi:hypothetical protein
MDQREPAKQKLASLLGRWWYVALLAVAGSVVAVVTFAPPWLARTVRAVMGITGGLVVLLLFTILAVAIVSGVAGTIGALRKRRSRRPE